MFDSDFIKRILKETIFANINTLKKNLALLHKQNETKTKLIFASILHHEKPLLPQETTSLRTFDDMIFVFAKKYKYKRKITKNFMTDFKNMIATIGNSSLHALTKNHYLHKANMEMMVVTIRMSGMDN